MIEVPECPSIVHDARLGQPMHALIACRILLGHAHFMTILLNTRIKDLVLESIIAQW
jgi:hypothetical protein